MYASAFWRYFVSHVVILFLTLNFICLVAVNHIAENVRLEEYRRAEGKLYTIAEDLDSQINSFRRIAFEISSSQVYNINYFQQHKYDEIEMLNQLSQYKATLFISDFYFIKYYVRDEIFDSNSKIMPLEVYLENYSTGEKSSELVKLIEDLCVDPTEKTVLYRDVGSTFFLYPLKMFAPDKKGKEAVLCFRVDDAVLKERIEKLVGEMSGSITICYKDICILGEDVEENEDVLGATSGSGNLNVLFQFDEESFFLFRNIFSWQEIVGLIAIVLILLVLAAILAFRHYLPMLRFSQKYNLEENIESTVNWESVDKLIDILLQGKESRIQKIQEQQQVIKEQIVRLIVSGGYSDKLLERMTLLNINIDASVYGVIRCCLKDVVQVDRLRENMVHDIEDLSDEEISLYSYWISDEELIVLAAMEEEYQLEEIWDLLHSLFEAKEISAQEEVLEVAHDIKQLNILNTQKPKRVKAINSKNEEYLKVRNTGRKSSAAKKVLNYIDENCTDYNISLEAVAEKFDMTPSWLCKIIKQETKMSYKEYLTELRINKARQLLMEGDLSVADVSQQVGYSSISYFIRLFQKYTGATPAKFRDDHLNLNEREYEVCEGNNNEK